MKRTDTKHVGESMGSSRSAKLHLLNNMGTIYEKWSLGIRRVKIFISIWGPSYADESDWDFTKRKSKAG